MRALLVLVLCAPAARADGIAEEVSAGTTLATSGSWISNRLSGTWDVDDRFTLQLDYSVTRSSSYAQSGALSLAYVASDHWSLAAYGSWVPAATSTSPATLEIEEDVMYADAELSATSSSISVAVSASYDTAGDSDHETSAGVSIGIDHVQSQQTFASIVAEDGTPLAADDLRAMCMTRACGPEVAAALAPLWSQLSRFALNANVTRTEYGETELGVDATYYIYDRDPLHAGYFRVPGEIGTGIALAPLRYAVSSTVANRWGHWKGTLGTSYGSYLAAQGYELGASVRCDHRLARSARLYASIASAWSVDRAHQLATSLAISLGGKITW